MCAGEQGWVVEVAGVMLELACGQGNGSGLGRVLGEPGWAKLGVGVMVVPVAGVMLELGCGRGNGDVLGRGHGRARMGEARGLSC